MMKAKRTTGALMTSLVIHFILVFIAGLYLVTQTQKFQNIISLDIDKVDPPKPPKVHKPIVKPTVSVESPVVTKPVPVQPRLTTIFARNTISNTHQTLLEFSNRAVKVDTPINPTMPKLVNPSTSMSDASTDTDIPMSNLPNALRFARPSTSAPSVGFVNVARGMAGYVQVKISFVHPPGLSMVENVGVERSALERMVGSITLGDDDIPPFPKNDPYGYVVGRGRDIRGGIRFARIRHSLSDWWADSSALNALTKWLNEKTKIRADMNVEGGTIKLTDANLHKTPIVFMTGHDPTFTRSRNLLSRQYGGGKIDNRFTVAEAAGLRKYLVEKGGFLVFDDCGVNAPAQAMVRLFLAQMRYVMPEYQVQRIENTHEVYNNFYQMGGPPIGFDIFWWGTRPPKRNFLEGVSVGDKLSVIVVRRDYMCAMESVSIPTRSAHYSPGVYRFLTNVMVYALTSGAISDYSDYVPEDSLVKKYLPTRAPQAAKIGATE